MKEWVRSAVAIAAFFGMATTAVIGIVKLYDSPTPKNGTVTVTIPVIPVKDSQAIGARVTIPPCPTEDSDNCYWMADTRGNGKGTSFVTIDGIVYLFGN